VRLTNHLDYFFETLNGTVANGRKLGFITQEMGREINTMGSKSNHAQMQKVVQMKDELEKIKEQVLNVVASSPIREIKKKNEQRRKINRVFGTFGIWNNDSQTSIKPRRFEFRILHFSSLANQEVKKQMEKIITSFQLKNSNNTSRMTFWNGKKFTETISTEL
jgi:tryptophanyl-tRNA synthetase